MVRRRVVSVLIVCLAVLTVFTSGSFGEAQKGEMAGYLGVPMCRLLPNKKPYRRNRVNRECSFTKLNTLIILVLKI